MGDLAALRDRVFDGIRSFIQERIIISAITKLASLLNPVGAIVQLVMAAWNIYTFVRDQLARLADLVRTIVGAIGDIARGVLDGAVAAVEGVLGRLLPLAIDLLARLLGLGNIAGKVREILGKIRGTIDRAIDKLLAKVVGRFRGGKGEKGATGQDDAVGAGGAQATEHFRIAGEDHTLKADAVAGRVVPVMASGSFGPLKARIKTIVEFIRKFYLSKGSDRFVGAKRAQQLRPRVAAIAARGDALVAEVRQIDKKSGADKHRAQKRAIRVGFAAIKQMFVALGIPEAHPSGEPEFTSAPGIGDVRAHGAQAPRVRSGSNPLLYTESEHVIPYAAGQVLLEAAGASAGKRKANRRFDNALITIVIYERAARIKTPVDNDRSKQFRRETADAVTKTAKASGDKTSAPVDWDVVLALLAHFRDDAIARTIAAVKREHGEKMVDSTAENGARRGEKQPIPSPAKIKNAGEREFTQLNRIFRRLWLAGAAASQSTGRPEIPSTSLAVLNVMRPDVITSIQGIGAAKAAQLVAARENGPFASKADLRARVPGLSSKFVSAIKDGG